MCFFLKPIYFLIKRFQTNYNISNINILFKYNNPKRVSKSHSKTNKSQIQKLISMSRQKLYLLLVLLLTILTVQSQLLAIDFGTQFIKASVVHSGAGKSFSIVQNSKSQRKFLNALAFFNEERFYQTDALPKRTRQPENCFLYSRMLIDFSKNPSMVTVVKKDLFLEYINENIEDQFLAEFVLKNFPKETRELTLLEVMTMILKYVKLEAEKFVKGQIKDAVLILPNYWTIHQRNFLLQAAAVADIYVLSIISENTAASINYALSQRNQNKTQNVLFFNVGSNALQMTLVEFRQILTESSPKPVESIFVKDDYGKAYVGGLRLDSIIYKYFEEIFEQKYKKKLDKRGLIKLLAESIRVKETLSSNKQASMFVEGIMDGIDFHSKMTRVEFEKRAEEVFKELTSPLKRFLLDNNMKAEDLHAVELIGGGSRIPKLQSMIADILQSQKEKIGTHINADESMALGGAFFAANSSKKFKVKGINLYDGFNFDVRLVLKNLDETIEQGDEGYFHKNATIFKKKNRFGFNKQVNFKCTHNLKAELYKVDIETLEEELLKSYEFDKIESFNETDFKLSLMFTIDPIEVVLLKDSKFTYKKDEVETYLEKVKKLKAKNETNEESWDEENEEEKEQKSAAENQQQEEGSVEKQQGEDKETKKTEKKNKKKKAEKVEYETVEKNKTVTKKYEKHLKSKQSFNIRKQEEKLNERTKNMLKNYEKAEQKKRNLSEARNKLEALIYETKDKLENEEFIRYSKETEREHLAKLADQKQEWHDESTSKNPEDYKKQYSELHKPLQQVKRRIIEHYEREHIKKRALSILKEHLNLTQSIQKGKEWISEEEVEELKQAFEDGGKKIREIFSQMQETEINEDAGYLNKDMIKEAEAVKDKYFALKAKPKPAKKEEKKEQKKAEEKSQESQKSDQPKNEDVKDDEL